MSITVSYEVKKDIYHSENTIHEVSLITTEYVCGNELLVHLQMGKKRCIHLNVRLSDLLINGTGITNEQFLFKKVYNQGDSKLITRSTFDTKMSRFDKSQTMTEREILEEYNYVDKCGQPDRVQIVITDNGEVTTTAIDFRDEKQC